MISVEVSTFGLEFDEVAQHLSGPLKQKLVEKLADIAYFCILRCTLENRQACKFNH